MGKILIPAEIEYPFLRLMVVPENISGNNRDPRILHLEQLPLPHLPRQAAEVKLACNGQKRPAVFGEIEVVRAIPAGKIAKMKAHLLDLPWHTIKMKRQHFINLLSSLSKIMCNQAAYARSIQSTSASPGKSSNSMVSARTVRWYRKFVGGAEAAIWAMPQTFTEFLI